MSKNTGKAYEKLSSEILSELYKIKEDFDMSSLKVELGGPGKTKKGLSTCHQIDVWIEYTDTDGNEHKYAVQAKDEVHPISQIDLLAFNTIINELGCKGIFVTKTGYQRGAIKVAKHYGIKIVTLRKPTNEDYFGRVMEISFMMSSPTITYIQPCPKDQSDNDKLRIAGEWKIRSKGGERRDIRHIAAKAALSLTEKNVSADIDLNDGLQVCVKKKDIDETDKAIEIVFLKFLTETFICLGDTEIEVIGMVIKYRWSDEMIANINADNLIQNLYTDVLTGEEYTISGLLGIRARESLPHNLEDMRRELIDSVHGKGAYDAYVKAHPEEKKTVKKAMKKLSVD